jgi:hypothetical protein
VTVRGANFGTRAWLEAVTYGPTGYEYAAANCTLAAAHTTLACFTAPGCGAGLRWVVRVRGQAGQVLHAVVGRGARAKRRPTYIDRIGPVVEGLYANVGRAGGGQQFKQVWSHGAILSGKRPPPVTPIRPGGARGGGRGRARH